MVIETHSFDLYSHSVQSWPRYSYFTILQIFQQNQRRLVPTNDIKNVLVVVVVVVVALVEKVIADQIVVKQTNQMKTRKKQKSD